MTARKYSIDEIDAMRDVIRVYGPSAGMSCDYVHENGTACYSISSLTAEEVESRLRTYMLAGTEPLELERVLRSRYEQAREWAADVRRMLQKSAAPARIDAAIPSTGPSSETDQKP